MRHYRNVSPPEPMGVDPFFDVHLTY